MQVVKKTKTMVVVSRQKLNGLGQHWGVLFPHGMVAHNTEEQGVTLVTLDVFAAGKKVKVVREVNNTQWTSTNYRFYQEIYNPKRYDLLENNCETFANRITGHNPETTQVMGVAVISTVLLLLLMAK